MWLLWTSYLEALLFFLLEMEGSAIATSNDHVMSRRANRMSLFLLLGLSPFIWTSYYILAMIIACVLVFFKWSLFYEIFY